MTTVIDLLKDDIRIVSDARFFLRRCIVMLNERDMVQLGSEDLSVLLKTMVIIDASKKILSYRLDALVNLDGNETETGDQSVSGGGDEVPWDTATS